MTSPAEKNENDRKVKSKIRLSKIIDPKKTILRECWHSSCFLPRVSSLFLLQLSVSMESTAGNGCLCLDASPIVHLGDFPRANMSHVIRERTRYAPLAPTYFARGVKRVSLDFSALLNFLLPGPPFVTHIKTQRPALKCRTVVGAVYTRGTRARAHASVVVVCGKAVEYSGGANLEQAEQTRRPRDVTHERDTPSPVCALDRFRRASWYLAAANPFRACRLR